MKYYVLISERYIVSAKVSVLEEIHNNYNK